MQSPAVKPDGFLMLVTSGEEVVGDGIDLISFSWCASLVTLEY